VRLLRHLGFLSRLSGRTHFPLQLTVCLGIACWVGINLAVEGRADHPVPGGFEQHPPSGPTDFPALSFLIEDYLTTDSPSRAAKLLTQILKHPGADLTSVSRAIQRGPRYVIQPTGRQPGLSIRIGRQVFRYGLYVPETYQSTREYPLIICLHGLGFTGDAYLERWQPRLGDDYILACPTLPEGDWWTRRAEELVLQLIRAVSARYRVDPDRIMLTGMSNGGIGTYIIGAHQAPLFAGISPMAAGLPDVLFPFLKNLQHTPVYIIHGSEDRVMPVELSRAVAEELRGLNSPVVYREHTRTHPMAGGHFFPREELPDLVSWFGSRQRDPLPKRLVVVRDATHLTAFGWVRIDSAEHIAAFSDHLIDSQDEAIVHRVYASLIAEVVAPNRIEVQTTRVRRYSLFLNETLVDFSHPLTIVTNGHLSFLDTVLPSVGTLLRQARLHQDRHVLFPALVTVPVEVDR
jgi:hypothetical protein